MLRMLLGAQLRRLAEAAQLPDVVYIEQLTSAVYLDQRATWSATWKSPANSAARR